MPTDVEEALDRLVRRHADYFAIFLLGGIQAAGTAGYEFLLAVLAAEAAVDRVGESLTESQWKEKIRPRFNVVWRVEVAAPRGEGP